MRRKGNTFLIEVDVKDQEDTEGWSKPEKTVKSAVPMDVDHAYTCSPCGFGKRTWEAFWEYSDGPTFQGQL